jgi:hypothetical protein
MSHGPSGLGGTSRPTPAPLAITNVATGNMSASASIITRFILVFILSPFKKIALFVFIHKIKTFV